MKMQDTGLDDILRGFPTLVSEPKENEYRIYRNSNDGQGSLWIARQKDGYRVVTTGTTHSIDNDIERITGMQAREMSDRNHKWGKSLPLGNMEKILTCLAETR